MSDSNRNIVIFKSADGKISVNVNFDMDTAWLSLDQIAELFDRDKSTISRHIKNIFKEGELQRDSVVAKFATTASDYDPKSAESIDFFKMVQNKLHYAAHGNTASEVIYLRVDSDKPFAGLTSFKGSQPTQAEAMIAKNYLSEKELRVLNNLVSAYFDLAELSAIEEREMRMADYVSELDNILASAGRKLLNNAGTIAHTQAADKAKVEYKKYKAKTLEQVEEEYLKTINALENKAKQESRKQ